MEVSNVTRKRLNDEVKDLRKNLLPFIEAKPDPSNLLLFYFVIKGPPDTPYHGGVYLGKLIFPKNFPSKPPGIEMITPNGRFLTNLRLCFDISDTHPETWNPELKISTILNGLLSFMTGNENTSGSINTNDDEKRKLAANSHSFNKRKEEFKTLFPHLIQ